jgi:Type IV secretion-system coupling protein DNA-binding domain
LVAQQEKARNEDLSSKFIVVDPSDPESSIGFNVLEPTSANVFVQVAEFTQILKKRWGLETFGARTEELLRNCLHVLIDNRATLIELAPLLSNPAYRAACLEHVSNAEVSDYFRHRFDLASEAMQSVMREPILNKISAFTTDPQFRHMLGQQRSTISLQEAMDRGYWVVLHLNRGRLGENAVTLAALLVAKLKNNLFSRSRRSLFTWYLDEVQNLVSLDSGLETVLSEARKFGVSVVFANQFFQQFPASMQAAVLAVGTHIFFQLSSADADKIGAALEGGNRLNGLLKNLQKRHVVIKIGSDHWKEVEVAPVPELSANTASLCARMRRRWNTSRDAVESEIRGRLRGVPARQLPGNAREELHDWD